MRLNVLFVAATLLVAASQPSAAQISVDMNQITCGSFLGYSPDIQEFVRSWMSGYYNAAANNKILNYDRFQMNSAKVTAYCRTHKSKTLPTAIKNLGLWQQEMDCIPAKLFMFRANFAKDGGRGESCF